MTPRRHFLCSNTSPFLPLSFLQHLLFCCLIVTFLVLSHHQQDNHSLPMQLGGRPTSKCSLFVLRVFSLLSKVQIPDGARDLFYFLVFHDALSDAGHFFPATEQPSSLHSSQGFGMGPVEESWFAPAPDHQPEENDFLLHSKLQEEANYHLYGSRMDRRTKEQPRPNMAYSSEEERKRRVSHDPFAQQRPYENAQSPGIKGLAYPGVMSHTSAAQQPAGLSSQPQSPYWRNGSFHPLGVRPLDLGTMSPRVWYGPNPGHMPSLYKTPVPETNLLGNTPTIPFTSLPSRGKWAWSHTVLLNFPENKASHYSVIN